MTSNHAHFQEWKYISAVEHKDVHFQELVKNYKQFVGCTIVGMMVMEVFYCTTMPGDIPHKTSNFDVAFIMDCGWALVLFHNGRHEIMSPDQVKKARCCYVTYKKDET